MNRDSGKLQIASQWVGKAIGQIHQADQHIQINNFAVVEVLFERGDVAVINMVRRAREFFGEGQRGFFFLRKGSRRWIFECLPIVRCKAGSLRRSEMVLQSIVALVDHGDAEVDQLVQPALHVAADAGIEGQKVLKYIRAVSQDFVDAVGLAFESFLINFSQPPAKPGRVLRS